MKIWDCFLYFNEDRLLEIRLHELAPVVNGFIIIEARTTHQGKNKESFLDLNRFRNYNIQHLFVDLPHKGEDLTREEAARNEVIQRNAISWMIQTKRDDIVILSDLDEIPTRETVELIRELGVLPIKVGCLCRYFHLNVEGPKLFSGYGPVAALGRDVLRATPQQMRTCVYSLMPSLEEGAWHFSFMGDVKAKVDAVCHHDDGHDRLYQDALDHKIEPLKVVEGPLPHLVREHPERYQDWLA